MALIDPTPSDIKADFPEFANVDDAAIQRRIDRTASRVDGGWGADYAYAKSLLTAHFLVEDGFGAGDAEIAAYRASGVTRLKSGTLDVAFSDGSASTGSEYGSTSYGLRFEALMRRLFAGPLTTGGGDGCIAGQATDTPFAWRYGGFAL